MAQRNYLISTTALSTTASGTTIGSGNTQAASFTLARTLVRTGIAAGEFAAGPQTWSIHYVVSAMATPYNMRLKVQRRNSSGVMQAESGYGATRSATGTYDDNLTADLGTWAANDELALVWEHFRPSGAGNKNATIDANGASYVDAPEPSPGVVLLADDFNDNSRDTAKWTLGSIGFQNASVGVSETNQQLEITPIANEPAAAIYGYQSVNSYDFTGMEAIVRLTASYGAPSEGWLVVVLDTGNYLRLHAVGGGSIFSRSRVATVNSQVDHGTFVFATHTYWKIRHDSGPDEIVWEYSSNGTSWTELRRLARPFAITAVTFYVSGGSGASSATPPVVKFDDFIARAPQAPATFKPAWAIGATRTIGGAF